MEKVEDKKGIKELTELVEGVLCLSVVLLENFKDGVQASDFVSIMKKLESDKEFRSLLMKSYDGMSEISVEIKDLDVSESAELFIVALRHLPKIVEALKN